jgi:hypothetical protein
MYFLLCSSLHFARSTALFGATLFSISNMYYIDLVHVHLQIVVVMPFLLFLVGKYLQDWESRPGWSRLWICAFSICLALIFYTSFYIAWFFVFVTGGALMLYALCVAIAERNTHAFSRMLRTVWKQRANLALGIGVFLAALVPFFALYLPSLHRNGKRTLSETLYYIPRPLGIFDVGKDNVSWGRVAGKIEDFISPGGIHEHPTGWPFITALVFLGTAIYCGVRLWRTREEESSVPRTTLCLMSAVSLTCLTLLWAGIKFGNVAPVWAALWKFVPGAAAIRVPQRIDLVLNIGVVVVCMFGFEQIRRALAGRSAISFAVPALLALALLGEQLNRMPTHAISRAKDAQKFSRISAPPKECSAFYASTWSGATSRMQSVQTDAMLVAQEYGIPTLNGYSSWFPQGWHLLWSAKGHVGEEAVQWAKQHGITDGLCSLDINTGTWSKADLDAYESAAYLGQPLDRNFADAGFEDPDLALWSPWMDVHAMVSTAQPHSGLHSLAEGDGVGSVYQDLNGLETGHTYRISAWVSGSPGSTAGAQIAAYDAANDRNNLSNTVHPGPTWQLLSDFVTVTKPGTIRVHLFRSEGSGTIYWDDLQVFRDDPPNEPGTAH